MLDRITRALNPLRDNPTKWSNTLKQFVSSLPTNCLSVFDHSVGLALKGLTGLGLLKLFHLIYSKFLTEFGTLVGFQSYLLISHAGRFSVLSPHYLLIFQSYLLIPPSRFWNTGLVSSGASLTSWGEGASLALVGHPSSDGVSKKMPYGVDVFIDQLCTPSSYWVG